MSIMLMLIGVHLAILPKTTPMPEADRSVISDCEPRGHASLHGKMYEVFVCAEGYVIFKPIVTDERK